MQYTQLILEMFSWSSTSACIYVIFSYKIKSIESFLHGQIHTYLFYIIVKIVRHA